jgi:uncharacterized membrane protein YebE (DUF533 family)
MASSRETPGIAEMNQLTKDTLLTGILLGVLWVIFTSALAAIISMALKQRQQTSAAVIVISGAIVAGVLCGRAYRHGWRKGQRAEKELNR